MKSIQLGRLERPLNLIVDSMIVGIFLGRQWQSWPLTQRQFFAKSLLSRCKSERLNALQSLLETALVQWCSAAAKPRSGGSDTPRTSSASQDTTSSRRRRSKRRGRGSERRD